MQTKHILYILIILFTFTACNSSSDVDLITIEEDDLNPASQEKKALELYKNGIAKVKRRNYKDAIKDFENVERLYPFSAYAIKSTRMIAYSHYKNKDFGDALYVLEKFISLNPGNKHISYAYYLKALCHYQQINDIERDNTSAKLALKSFNDVIKRFPNSEYTRDAKLKRDLVMDHLAGKEMEVGRFYLKEKNFIAAINRFQNVVKKYENTSHIKEALYRLVEANTSVGLDEEAQKSAAILGYNYPDSKWYKYAYKIIKENSNSPEDRKGWIKEICSKYGISYCSGK